MKLYMMLPIPAGEFSEVAENVSQAWPSARILRPCWTSWVILSLTEKKF